MRRDRMNTKMVTLALLLLSAGLLLGAQGNAQAQTTTCGTTTWNLTAGQTIVVGSVTVSNDSANLYITYALDYPGATFGTLHTWVGNDLTTLPRAGRNGDGAPIQGQFPYIVDATGTTSYTLTIPVSALQIQDVFTSCGLNLNVVTHAEVTMDKNGDGTMDHETAYGGDKAPDADPNRWWYYGVYTVCCDFGEPPCEICSTAFAKGANGLTYVFTTDKKSNPENLASLGLSRNRWGWAMNLKTAGTYPMDLWSGAGLNKTSNGVKVGTATVVYNGSQVTVTYAITAAGYSLKEVHVYAGDGKPTTVAPGQYGLTDYLEPHVATATYTVPVGDSDGDGVWVILHAVVCR